MNRFQRGFTLMELVVATAISGAVLLGAASVVNDMVQRQTTSKYRTNLTSLKNQIISNIQNDQAWANTVVNNAVFGCLSTAAGCTQLAPTEISLYDAGINNGGVMIGTTNGGALPRRNAFALDGRKCTDADAAADCPIHATVQWRPLCVSYTNNLKPCDKDRAQDSINLIFTIDQPYLTSLRFDVNDFNVTNMLRVKRNMASTVECTQYGLMYLPNGYCDSQTGASCGASCTGTGCQFFAPDQNGCVNPIAFGGGYNPTCADADVNSDGHIDYIDKAYVSSKIGTTATSGGWDPKADLNRNNQVTSADSTLENNLVDSTCVCPSSSNATNFPSCNSCTSPAVWNGSSCNCTNGAVDPKSGCVTCAAPRSRWTGSSCDCPIGQNWNGSSCVTCTGGQVWNAVSLSCQCPAATPVWNGSSCGCAAGSSMVAGVCVPFSCAADPACVGTGACTKSGSIHPSTQNVPWTYGANAAAANTFECGYSCNTGFSGPGCGPNSCAADPVCSSSSPQRCTKNAVTNPLSQNVPWMFASAQCGFSCNAPYSNPNASPSSNATDCEICNRAAGQTFPTYGTSGTQCLKACGALGGNWCGAGSCPAGKQPVPGGPSYDCATCCNDVPITLSCAANPTCVANNSCSLQSGTPTMANQAWVQGAPNCGYNCTNGYTGSDCMTAPVFCSAASVGPTGSDGSTCIVQTPDVKYACTTNNTTLGWYTSSPGCNTNYVVRNRRWGGFCQSWGCSWWECSAVDSGETTGCGAAACTGGRTFDGYACACPSGKTWNLGTLTCN